MYVVLMPNKVRKRSHYHLFSNDNSVWKRYTNRQAFILFLCYQRYSFLQTLHCQVFFCQLQQWVIRMLFMQCSDHSGTTACNFYPTGIHSSRPFVHYLCREMLVEHAEVRVNVNTVTLLLGTISNFNMNLARKADISNLRLCCRLRLSLGGLFKWVSTLKIKTVCQLKSV